jgi:hypothetical protein
VDKLTRGIIMMIAGWGAVMLGIVLTSSLIGACIGIPMLLIGLPFGIWGTVWFYQGMFAKQQQMLAGGIAQGIAQARQSTPPATMAMPAQPPADPNLERTPDAK